MFYHPFLVFFVFIFSYLFVSFRIFSYLFVSFRIFSYLFVSFRIFSYLFVSFRIFSYLFLVVQTKKTISLLSLTCFFFHSLCSNKKEKTFFVIPSFVSKQRMCLTKNVPLFQNKECAFVSKQRMCLTKNVPLFQNKECALQRMCLTKNVPLFQNKECALQRMCLCFKTKKESKEKSFFYSLCIFWSLFFLKNLFYDVLYIFLFFFF